MKDKDPNSIPHFIIPVSLDSDNLIYESNGLLVMKLIGHPIFFREDGMYSRFSYRWGYWIEFRTPKFSRNGYTSIGLNCTENKLMIRYHRALWLAFNPNEIIEDSLVIDHINGVRTDNRISNLRKVSIKVNNRNNKKVRETGLLAGVSYCNTYNNFIVMGDTINGRNYTARELVGRYPTYKEAEISLLHYRKTGEKILSTNSRQSNKIKDTLTGRILPIGITYHIERNKYVVRSKKLGIRMKRYSTLDEAINYLNKK